MHVIMVVTYGEPKKGYLNFTLGNLWATQPIALLIWPPLYLPYIELGRWLCSHFQLETPLNFQQADNARTIQRRAMNLISLDSLGSGNRFMYTSNPKIQQKHE